MTSTELVLFDPVFHRFQTTAVPVLHRQLHQACLPFDVDPDHHVNWRFYEPGLDDLEGLDYWDEARRLDPSLVDSKNFLDGFEADHLAETGHLPRAQWYRDARQSLRIKARLTRQQRLTREWARGLDGGTFSLGDADDSTTSGTEQFSDSFQPASKLRVKTWTGPNGHHHSKLVALDSEGHVLPPAERVVSRQTAERYRDRSVAETAIFHPVPGDGLTLDEMLSDMRRFEIVSGATEWEPDPVEFPLTHGETIDSRYVRPDEAKRAIRAAKQVVELADLRAKAVEICRFPWSDERANQWAEQARGWVRRSRLLDWGSDTWQVILTRKRHGITDEARSYWTVFVRTHTGSETVRRSGRPDLQVWTWEPHYYAVFPDEEQGTQFLERLEDAFLRERHGDLDQERWPQDLLNDRSVAASIAADKWRLWQKRERDGWRVTNLDGSAPGAIEFTPNEALSYDPGVLQSLVDAEYADYEAAQQ